jgi:hypothetical protein
LQNRNDGGLGGGFVAAGARFFLFGLHHALDQEGYGAFAFCGLAYFRARCEDA